MTSPPINFERVVLFHHFKCPWCRFTTMRPFTEKTSWNVLARSSLKPRYWCSSCGRCSWFELSVPALFIWYLFCILTFVMFGIGPLEKLIESYAGVPQWLLWLVAGAIILAAWPAFTRRFSRYEPADPAHP